MIRGVISFFLLFLSGIACAQISLDFPLERAVFQRTNSNTGFVHITGNGPESSDSIEGRLIPMNLGQGTATDWQVIDNQLKGGAFLGKISGAGGWYQLQIRAIKNGQVIANLSRNRIGIGEVFIVAGQSNAQGFLKFNPKGAFDDRVNGYGEYRELSMEETPLLTHIQPIYREFNIGPRGQSAWAWGELGDKLVAKLNVPVLFFNVAYEGTNIENWVKSAKGLPTTHTGFGYEFENNAPYSFLRIILQNHAAVYGLRSILWMQGENDWLTSQADYKSGLDFLINKTSIDVGKNINWVVCRTSYIFSRVYEQIIAAQNDVILSNSRAFGGPFTDYLQEPRIDGVHLSEEGISALANALDANLSEFFLQTINPIIGEDLVELSYACVGDGVVNVAPSKSFSSHQWSSGSQNPSIQLKEGSISGRFKDSKGNYHLSEKLEIANLFPEEPSVVASNGGNACIGDSVIFSVQAPLYNLEWSDGSTDSLLVSYNTEPIYVNYIDDKGCKSISSPEVRAVFITKPSPPTISNDLGGFGACVGEIIKLRANSEHRRFRWSNGETTSSVTISATGESELSVLTITDDGCESEFSEPTKVKIFPRPSPPVIEQSGPYSLAVSNSQTYSSFEWYFEGSRFGIQTGPGISVGQNGFYSIKGFETHDEPFSATCLSNESGLLFYERNAEQNGILAFPNPAINNEFYLTSDGPVDAIISLKDMSGKTVLAPTVIRQLTVPRKIQLSKELSTGKYILTVEYSGVQKRFNLFLE